MENKIDLPDKPKKIPVTMPQRARARRLVIDEEGEVDRRQIMLGLIGHVKNIWVQY